MQIAYCTNAFICYLFQILQVGVSKGPDALGLAMIPDTLLHIECALDCASFVNLNGETVLSYQS